MSDKPASSSNTPGGFQALRDLTLRLLSEEGLDTEEILVGRLPDGFPADIPILEDTLIIGSQISSTETQTHFTVLFGTNLSPEQVLDLYDQRLQAMGWFLPNTGS